MAKKRKRRPAAAAARDKPTQKRSLVWFGDWQNGDDLKCSGYISLDQNPEISAAVDRIATLIGSMTIYLMQNGDNGDIRVKNELSRLVDINPDPNMTRSNWVKWIVRTMMLEGHGNAVVYPVTGGGYLQRLTPIPPALTSFEPVGFWDYKILISGKPIGPDNVLHFALNPGTYYPWWGTGYTVSLADVANSLKQASVTSAAFMSSKWKPSLIVKVDALTEEFAGKEGRKRLLADYVDSGEAGAPWIIPAEQFSVEQVKPLTLSDLALADFVKLDKQTVASVLGIPPFLLGVGEFKREAYNNFIASTVMPIAQILEQELTRKLLIRDDWFFRFNSRSLYNYSLDEIIKAGSAMVNRMAMTRNEWRAWLNLPPREDMDELLVLENYLPVDRLGDQKKLLQQDEGGGEEE